MKALFLSETLQSQFEKDGFVKVPLLSAEEVQELSNAYNMLAAEHEAINIPYITTSHSNNADLITRVDNILQKVMAPAIDKFMMNYHLLFGNFLVKMPVPNSETSPHQDITFVDESQYASVNIWVALQDTTPENGCMFFLRGSHNLVPTLRPTHHYPWLYEHVKDDIVKHVEIFPAKAGDAFIFNHAVVHGSFANTTNEPRVAAVIAAYHNEAELLHYYLPEGAGNMVQKYAMTKDAFLSFVKNQPPSKGVFLQEMEYDFKQLNAKEFNQLLPTSNGSYSFMRTISKLFKG